MAENNKSFIDLFGGNWVNKEKPTEELMVKRRKESELLKFREIPLFPSKLSFFS